MLCRADPGARTSASTRSDQRPLSLLRLPFGHFNPSHVGARDLKRFAIAIDPECRFTTSFSLVPSCCTAVQLLAEDVVCATTHDV
jgi:hypothetical protein